MKLLFATSCLLWHSFWSGQVADCCVIAAKWHERGEEDRFTQNVNGTLTLEVAPTTADKLAVTGTASLNGTLSLVFAPGTYTTTTFNLISAASITGKISVAPA